MLTIIISYVSLDFTELTFFELVLSFNPQDLRRLGKPLIA